MGERLRSRGGRPESRRLSTTERGPSWHSLITVTSALSLLVGASVTELSAGDPARHAAVAASLALIIGVLHRGVAPIPGLPPATRANLNSLLPAALAGFVLCAVETSAIGRIFGQKHGYRSKPDRPSTVSSGNGAVSRRSAGRDARPTSRPLPTGR